MARPGSLDWYGPETVLTDELIGRLWREFYRHYPDSLGHKLIRYVVNERIMTYINSVPKNDALKQALKELGIKPEEWK